MIGLQGGMAGPGPMPSGGVGTAPSGPMMDPGMMWFVNNTRNRLAAEQGFGQMQEQMDPMTARYGLERAGTTLPKIRQIADATGTALPSLPGLDMARSAFSPVRAGVQQGVRTLGQGLQRSASAIGRGLGMTAPAATTTAASAPAATAAAAGPGLLTQGAQMAGSVLGPAVGLYGTYQAVNRAGRGVQEAAKSIPQMAPKDQPHAWRKLEKAAADDVLKSAGEGAISGAGTGASIGGTVGSAGGPPGAAIGAGIGAAIGGAIGGTAGLVQSFRRGGKEVGYGNLIDATIPRGGKNWGRFMMTGGPATLSAKLALKGVLGDKGGDENRPWERLQRGYRGVKD